MPATVVVGGFFGDEGKGKIISYLALKDKPEIVVRGGVGPNAGHTFVLNGEVHKVRMLPSAVLNKGCRLMIGAGVVINPEILLTEISKYNAQDRVFIDRQCGVIESSHINRDKADDLKGRIGTTGSGTGPANSDRALRTLHMASELKELSPYLGDVSNAINFAIDRKEKVLVEGTQGTFLSLYHGSYPYVTSKDVTASAICADIGLGPKRVDEVMLVFKAYVTRVGAGLLQNELSKEEAQKRGWFEVATVTGRERRAAPFNFDLARRAIMLNSATQLALTKLDIVFPECVHVRQYDKLSNAAKSFIEEIENATGLKITVIGTGEDIYDIVDRRS
ncbi:MAG: adenylosuccinate synthase [Candidatus Nitrosomirales archaeon]|jgi:adenylosuccinate synthase